MSDHLFRKKFSVVITHQEIPHQIESTLDLMMQIIKIMSWIVLDCSGIPMIIDNRISIASAKNITYYNL